MFLSYSAKFIEMFKFRDMLPQPLLVWVQTENQQFDLHVLYLKRENKEFGSHIMGLTNQRTDP